MTKRQRVSLRIDAEVSSLEGKLVSYLKEDPILPPRDAAMRAIKAFYMPWVLENDLDQAQLQNLAATAVEELQFRIFQIQQRYGIGGAAAFITPPPRQSVLSHNGSSAAPMASVGAAPTIAEMRQQINPAELDDF
ncbi:MAG: hypothetical protein AAF289_21625 [Cyanobacteria bacterium P01_A01_bin.135]